MSEWEYESGFQSEIWACEAEWRECEGLTCPIHQNGIMAVE